MKRSPISPANTRGFSLRKRCLNLGIDPGPALTTAHNLLTTVPGLSVRRYNPIRPMSGIREA